MPYLCCVPKCSNSVLNPERRKYSFHRFPKEEKFILKWLENIKRSDLNPTKHTRICSVHFEDWCFLRDEPVDPLFPFRRRNLRAEAIPTLFNDDINLVKRVRKFGNRKNKKEPLLQSLEVTQGTNSSDSSEVEKSGEGVVSSNSNHHNNNNNNDFQPHSIDYDSIGFNGSSEFEAPPHSAHQPKTENNDEDTYELTELTPMVKQEQRIGSTPLGGGGGAGNHYDDTSYHHSITTNNNTVAGDPYHHHHTLKDGTTPPIVIDLFGSDAVPNNNSAETTLFTSSYKRCLVSENFLNTLFRLIKCPQCGYQANPEQMHKYENQGCLLGVRLQCYNGHTVLDWRL